MLKEINKQAKKWRRVIPCLLQVYIAKEETKFGLEQDELLQLIHSDEFKSFENIKVMNFEGALRGMRNQKNSWHLSDSKFDISDGSHIPLSATAENVVATSNANSNNVT